MPGSGEMFGQQGAGGLGPGMTPGVNSRNYGFEPSAEEFEKKMEAMRYNKIVKLIDYSVKTFDLSREDHVKDYRKLYIDLYNKCAGGSVVIHAFEREFIKDPANPRYLIHIEWSEFEFNKEDLLEEDKEEEGEEEADDTQSAPKLPQLNEKEEEEMDHTMTKTTDTPLERVSERNLNLKK